MCVAVAFQTIVIRHFCRPSKRGKKYKFRGSSDMHLPFKRKKRKKQFPKSLLSCLGKDNDIPSSLSSFLSNDTGTQLPSLTTHAFPNKGIYYLPFFPFLSTCFCAGNLFLASSYFLKGGGERQEVFQFGTRRETGRGRENRLDFLHVPSIPKYSGGVTTMGFEEEEEEGETRVRKVAPN